MNEQYTDYREFAALTEGERADIFADAEREVSQMLELNLLRTFHNSDAFVQVRPFYAATIWQDAFRNPALSSLFRRYAFFSLPFNFSFSSLYFVLSLFSSFKEIPVHMFCILSLNQACLSFRFPHVRQRFIRILVSWGVLSVGTSHTPTCVRLS